MPRAASSAASVLVSARPSWLALREPMMATEWRARSDASPSMCTVPHPGTDAVLEESANGRVRAAMDVSNSMKISVMANCEMSNPSMASMRTIYRVGVREKREAYVARSKVACAWSFPPQGLRPTCGGKVLDREVGSGARRGRSGDARGTRGWAAGLASAGGPERARALESELAGARARLRRAMRPRAPHIRVARVRGSKYHCR